MQTKTKRPGDAASDNRASEENEAETTLRAATREENANLENSSYIIAPVDALRFCGQGLDWSGRTGGTRHFEVFKLALCGAEYGVPPETTMDIAAEFVEESGGTAVQRDIEHQVRNAYRYRAGHDSYRIDPDEVTHRSALFSREALREKASGVSGTKFGSLLRYLSAEPFPKSPREFLSGLFASSEKVFLADRVNASKPLKFADGGWRPKDDRPIKREAGVWFLINPVTGEAAQHERFKSKHNPKGESLRCEETLTAWRHLVLECDHEGPGVMLDWIKYLMQLPLAVRAIYTSGGRSVHALVGVHASSKEEWLAKVGPLKADFVQCGADPAALRGVQLSRLPFCLRKEKGPHAWQRLLYWQPEADETSIVERL